MKKLHKDNETFHYEDLILKTSFISRKISYLIGSFMSLNLIQDHINLEG